MPVEVREIIIKATIDQDIDKKSGDSSGGRDENTSEKEMIISECVEQILEILQEKAER